MKRILLSLMLFCGIGAAVLLATRSPVLGGTFSNRDLDGDYLFVVTEIRNTFVAGLPVIDYCSGAGTITFDGAGAATVALEKRCSASGTSSQTDALGYSVNVDGSFTLTGPADPLNPVHGQIVSRGRSLLIDGTLMTDPDSLLFAGTAMQR